MISISDNEIQWFTGEEDYDKGVQMLQEKYQIPLILLSMGKDGSRAYHKGMKVDFFRRTLLRPPEREIPSSEVVCISC